MMIQSLRKTREFTGPTPHSVAILAKPKNKLPVEQIILERRKHEEQINKTIQETKEQKQFDLKSEWERASDKKVQQNIVTRRVEVLLQREKFNLQERRDKLRQLLLAEEAEYLEEMEANEESIEDRQEKMRQRATELRAKREAERQALVAEKLDQKFRGECEELRSIVSHRQRDELFKERQTQLAEKAAQQQQESEIKQMYAELWEQDRLAKAQKEELEAQEQMKKNREMVEILNHQKAGLERKKEEERQFKQYETEWLKQEATIRAEEDKFLAEERKRKQMAARRNRDISIKLKNKKEGKEKQEQLAMDMKILQKVIEDTKNEEIEDISRKKMLRDENQRFMHYVEMTRKEEKERQQRFALVVDDEIEKQFARRDEKKEREKAARQALLNNVLITRREQVNEKDQTRKKEQEGALHERQELLQQIEEYKRLEAEQIERLRVKNKTYQTNLVQQVKFQKKKNDREIEEARKEIESFQDAEKTYQRKLKSALDRPERTHRQHPFRVEGIGFTARAKSS